MLAENIKTGLEDENFAVDVAFNGLDAYELAGGEEYDVIILDIMLPGMDGVTLCKKLRTEKNYTPILMLTAKDAIEDKVTGLDDGADDYMVKPVEKDVLLQHVEALLTKDSYNGK